MRIFTCTPVDFIGNADFFARDSGLLCRGFLSIGIESNAVMPGPGRPDDAPDLIRTDYSNLESSDWWKSLHLDGVVLYAWGRPKFTKIARAIQRAGIYLILNQDNGGLVSPLAGFRSWLDEQWNLSGKGQNPAAILRFLALTVRGLTLGLLVTDPLRASHLGEGDVVACVSPKAAERYQKLCRSYGGLDLAKRVNLLPHPIEPKFHYRRENKHPGRIACIGRWQDQTQKRPKLLGEVLERLLGADISMSAQIAGEPGHVLTKWYRSLPARIRERVHLLGKLGRGELINMLNEAEIFYSPSAYESFGIAAAEALCCGCSVVAGRSTSMASFEWFVSENSGTLAADDSVEGHFAALRSEASEWRLGHRQPREISSVWCDRLHADRIAQTICGLIAGRLGETC